MRLADLLREGLEGEDQDARENERMPTPLHCFAVQRYSMGLSLREIEAVLDWLGVGCCHQAIWYWNKTRAESQSEPPTAAPSWVTVDVEDIDKHTYTTEDLQEVFDDERCWGIRCQISEHSDGSEELELFLAGTIEGSVECQ